MLNSLLEKVLFVLVTCSRDKSRDSALKNTINSLAKENRVSRICNSLIVFDNDSLFKNSLKELPNDVKIINSRSNIGYWGALDWVFKNFANISERSYEYVHPIESDLILYDTRKLTSAVRFLDRFENYHTVRTQEFSVKLPWRYFKESPAFIRKNRSCVSGYDFITKKKVRFSKIEEIPDMFTTQWHAKVPALHRFAVLKSAFGHLADLRSFKEGDFMRYMHSAAPQGIGVLDGGIYYDQLGTPDSEGVSGSYSSQQDLDRHQYMGTRIATITGEVPEVFLSSPSECCGII
jgi:hypothetical protein